MPRWSSCAGTMLTATAIRRRSLLSGYFHKIGFNMAFAGLGTERQLIEQVDAAIADMTAKGELESMAKAAGMTYVAPAQPDILEAISIVDFFKD